MRFAFLVEVEVQFLSGKFASRESIEDEIREALESADPGSYSGDGENAEYETADWSVSELPTKPKAQAAALEQARPTE